MHSRQAGLTALLLLLIYPMWVTGGTQPSWQAPMPVLALILGAVLLHGQRPALRHDPLTLAGGMFIALLMVQWLNSNRELTFDPLLQVWVYAPPPVSFLPSSVVRAEAGEMLRWFFPAWMVALATRHLVRPSVQTARFMMTAILTAACVLSAASILQFALATQWGIGEIPSRSYFITSFGYANQAGSFFLLMFAVALGGTLSALVKHSRRRMLTGILFSLLLLGGVLVSLSRAAILLAMTILACALLFLAFAPDAQAGRAERFHRIMTALALAMAAFLLTFPLLGDPVVAELSTRYAPTENLPLPANWSYSALANIRPVYRQVAVQILRASPWFGAGGWAVRHLGILHLPASQHAFMQTPGAANTHNDFLQFLSEFGLLGGALLLLSAGILAVPVFKHRHMLLQSPRICFSLLGLTAVGIHGCVDLPFRSPAVLYHWVFVLAILDNFLPKRYRLSEHTAPSQTGDPRG